MDGKGFEQLSEQKYVCVVTFRRNGDEVATPVWVVELDGALYVRTDSMTGKVKRLRREPRAVLAPCTFRGKEIGPRVEARALLRDPAERPAVIPALDRKYGLPSRLAGLMGRLRRRTAVILELHPAPASSSPSDSHTRVPAREPV